MLAINVENYVHFSNVNRSEPIEMFQENIKTVGQGFQIEDFKLFYLLATLIPSLTLYLTFPYQFCVISLLRISN